MNLCAAYYLDCVLCQECICRIALLKKSISQIQINCLTVDERLKLSILWFRCPLQLKCLKVKHTLEIEVLYPEWQTGYLVLVPLDEL